MLKSVRLDEKELKKMGFNAYKIVQNYHWSKQAIKMKDVYNWILYNNANLILLFFYNNLF